MPVNRSVNDTSYLYCICLKGTVSRDGYFLKCLSILISAFRVCADIFTGLKAFHYPITKNLAHYFTKVHLRVHHFSQIKRHKEVTTEEIQGFLIIFAF
jgi:hypothetical protein